MDIKDIALCLLIMRLASVSFMVMVIRKQIGLFAGAADRYIRMQRRVLFTFALMLLAGNIIPILIDIATLMVDTGRTNPKALSVAYAFSNAGTSILHSVMVWVIYRIAERSQENA